MARFAHRKKTSVMMNVRSHPLLSIRFRVCWRVMASTA